jgi:HEPN domain-containing protein
MKSSQEEAKRWFLQALRDLADAKFNLLGERFNVACFLAQQSAEKAMKAYLFLKGADEVWGHSVGELCEDAKNFDEEFKEIETAAKSLDKYYIPTRYPNALPGGIPSESFDKTDAEKAISLAEKIINFIKSKTGGEL